MPSCRPAKPWADEQLVVYSSRKEQLVKPLFDAFEKETGIHVTYQTGKEGPLIERLNLTDEQSVQIEPILESNFHASMLVLESHGIDLSVPREQRARPNFREIRAIGKELQAVREETAEEMAEFLTEEQMEEYRKIQEERRAEMREQIGARR